MKICFLLLLTGVLGVGSLWSQQWPSSKIYHEIQKLNVLGKVLYLAAHPDDENTRFIAYCANQKQYETAYMSLTRGDGGQNLIGPELREELGLIRTQELLAARRTDGGQQFFSRANDFGYSKNPEETFRIWDKEKVLGDLIYVIRSFQPDVIVCRFPADGGGGHGHHTASAILGAEAFKLAADKNAYPEQLKEVTVWQPKRIVTNTGRWWNPDISAEDKNVVAEDCGAYSTLLGISCNEIAAHSRTKHKSQGFGSTGSRGEQMEYFEHVDGVMAKNSLFDDFSDTWSKNGQTEVEEKIKKILEEFNVGAPELSIQSLFELRSKILGLKQSRWSSVKAKDIEVIIAQCAGLYFEVRTSSKIAALEDSVQFKLELISRNIDGFEVEGITGVEAGFSIGKKSLMKNIGWDLEAGLKISNQELSTPYWLKNKGTLGTYALERQSQVLFPENQPGYTFTAKVKWGDFSFDVEAPLVYKENDPVKGEIVQPFYVVPHLNVRPSESNLLVKTGQNQEVFFYLKAMTTGVKGVLEFDLPAGWNLVSAERKEFDLAPGEELLSKIVVSPGKKATMGDLKIFAKLGGTVYDKEVSMIEYDHIPTQMMVRSSSVKLSVVDLKISGSSVGYFAGAGDQVPEALKLMGYKVTMLEEKDLDNLSGFDAIMVGIRAVNVNDRIGYVMPKLLAYAENGGTLVLQYNTRHRLKTDDFGSYPLTLSRDRVTDENAKVKLLNDKHPVMNVPNKLSLLDFDNWVQERGLYFPSEWDEKYLPMIEWNDPGESPKQGALLVAEYGKGHYVYTSISLFRQLPAGVPGAYRLVANLLAL